MRRVVLIVLMVASAVGMGCQQEKYADVDFSRHLGAERQHAAGAPRIDSALTMVVAGIISAKDSYEGFNALGGYLHRHTGRPIRIRNAKTYQEAYHLLGTRAADMGIVCTGLYILARREKLLRLLVVPVVNGQSTYQAYIIVARDAKMQDFSDLAGRSFVFVDKLSLTGYYYPVYRAGGEVALWRETHFSGSHDKSIELVNRGLVEAGSIDGLVYEDMARRFPQRIDNIRIIEKSEEFGIPPIVVTPQMDAALYERLQAVLLGMNQTQQGREILRGIGMEAFTTAKDAQYDGAEKMVH